MTAFFRIVNLILLPGVYSSVPNAILKDFSENYCTLLFTTFYFEQGNEIERERVDTYIFKEFKFRDNPRVYLNLPSFTFPSSDFSRHWRGPLKILAKSNCVYVIVSLPDYFSDREEKLIEKLVTVPILAPQAVKNRDRFLLFSRNSLVKTLSKSRVINSLKYKLVITYARYMEEEGSSRIFQFCEHCVFTVRELYDILRPGLDRLFPDFENNFHGKMLKMSTSDKVPQLLELVKDTTGKITAKRGLYLSVIKHLEKGLNFTAELLISSNGGSTGTLKNGIWTGIIGDVFNGQVDIGIMAAVTVYRYQAADICAPINFAFMGFVVGPPKQVYTWKAIFWPFTVGLWVGTILSLAGAILGTLILMSPRFQKLTVKQEGVWNIGACFETYCRSFLDQGDDKLSTESTNFSLRMFLVVWLLSVLVLSTAYKSKMVGFMTFPVLTDVPKNFDDLASSSSFSVDFHYFGNVGYALFETSKTPTFSKIFQKMRKEQDIIKCLSRTAHQLSACITFVTTWDELKHRNFSDKRGQSPLKFESYTGVMFPAGVVTEHKSKLRENFKRILSFGLEMHLNAVWEKKDMQQTLRNKNEWERSEGHYWVDAVPEWNNGQDDVLRLKNLKGAIAVLVTGSFIAVFTALWEFMKTGPKKNLGRDEKIYKKTFLPIQKKKNRLFVRTRFWIRFWSR